MPLVSLVVEDKYDFVVNVNVSVKKLETAYKRGAKRLGYDFELFEGCVLAKPVFNKLKALGWTSPKGFANTREMDVETYIDIWIFIAKLGDAQLSVKVPKVEQVKKLHIGGYALLWARQE